MIDLLGGASAQRFACSRSSCTSAAQWAILWRNPKIHDETRRKTWLACDEHVAYLRDFLAARSFPLEVVTIDELERRSHA